jgi:hypothetical protein
MPHYLHHAIGGLERRLDRIVQAGAVALAHNQPIDDNSDIVILPPIE